MEVWQAIEAIFGNSENVYRMKLAKLSVFFFYCECFFSWLFIFVFFLFRFQLFFLVFWGFFIFLGFLGFCLFWEFLGFRFQPFWAHL